jgi:transcriptional regulator with XRE-family HTH domain
MTKDEFAARLRELREEKGWTQAELAERVGVSAHTVAQWERSRREPSWNNVVAMADALGVSTEAFRQLPKEVLPRPKAGRPKKTPPAEPGAASKAEPRKLKKGRGKA